jgi:hypothetical protein
MQGTFKMSGEKMKLISNIFQVVWVPAQAIRRNSCCVESNYDMRVLDLFFFLMPSSQCIALIVVSQCQAPVWCEFGASVV